MLGLPCARLGNEVKVVTANGGGFADLDLVPEPGHSFTKHLWRGPADARRRRDNLMRLKI